MLKHLMVAIALAIPLADGAGAAEETRIALVIGNQAYETLPALASPTADATAVAGALRSAGFDDVAIASDLSKAAMLEAIAAFGQKAGAADWAVVYYGGHGVSVSGNSYLIPVDARIAPGAMIDEQAVSLGQVLEALRSAKVKVVLFNAARDNPAGAQESKSAGSGGDPGDATIVGFAVSAGAALPDAGGGGSPFASALVKHLATPGLEISKFFTQVRDDVIATTGAAQTPSVYAALPGEDIYFRPAE